MSRAKFGVWPRRTIALSGAFIAIVGHGLLMTVTDINTLVMFRVTAGLGAGMLMAAGNATVASAKNPDKLYSILMFITGLAHMFLLSLGPVVANRWDYPGVYGKEDALEWKIKQSE